ncbi:hypothetical protein FA09DRAFT_158301 [Tilletiopsis washingtonensis]|uniref:Uncharacterized protein n=1 Tax=Tilletiopsis washingtonensis TaxID=58919 RepID=A0A316Z4E6_9BASI|nr:hypothetical protein FA09DRAFT_158301 [Tilletiopsis washingtonensis]PWN95043.1 hypothetical protein FA09DRAFT_158301 [Tilletiopsis washingtonensis]
MTQRRTRQVREFMHKLWLGSSPGPRVVGQLMHAACPDVQGTEHIAPIHAAAARAVLDVAETVAMRQRRCMRGNASVAMHARQCMRRNACAAMHAQRRHSDSRFCRKRLAQARHSLRRPLGVCLAVDACAGPRLAPGGTHRRREVLVLQPPNDRQVPDGRKLHAVAQNVAAALRGQSAAPLRSAAVREPAASENVRTAALTSNCRR